jgi:NADH-quinone oxidoreductase subunit C
MTEAVPESVADAPVDAAAAGAPELLHGYPVSSSRGQRVIHPSREQYLDLARALLDDGYHLFVDLTAVDYLLHSGRPLPPGVTPERFEVSLVVRNMDDRTMGRVRVQIPDDDPTLPSLFDLWPGAEAPEREVFDLFGISFEGHPDLTRILMPEDWVGFPLRKDDPIGEIPVQFTSARGAPEIRR